MIPRFLLHLLLLLYKLSVSDILVQIRYDTCIPILYELNYSRPLFGPPVLSFVVLQAHIYISTGSHTYLKIIPTTCIAGGLFYCHTKKPLQTTQNRLQRCFLRIVCHYARCQISSLYCAMVRSEEKKPAFAMLIRHFLFHASLFS